jgi:hypothetical protein
MSEKEKKGKNVFGSERSDDSTRIGLVFSKRNEFVLRTYEDHNYSNQLNIHLEKSGQNNGDTSSLNSANQRSDTTGDIESLQKLNEEISNTLFENTRPDLVYTKRNHFVLCTPDENNNISELINLPPKEGTNGGNEITQNQIQGITKGMRR